MEKNTMGNMMGPCGNIDGKTTISHIIYNRSFSIFPLRVPMLSGFEDVINIVCVEKNLQFLAPDSSTMLLLIGKLRSYNNKSGVGNKLELVR